jgi:hypothetical protein
MVSMQGLPAFAAGTGLIQPGAAPTEPTQRRENVPGDDDIVWWGTGNDYPQIVRDRFSKNTLIPETLAKKAAFWMGGGIYATRSKKDDEELEDPEISAFLRLNTTELYLEESFLHLAWFANVFPELIISKDRSKILSIHSNETPYARWGRKKDKVYLNANWPNAKATDPETIVLPVLDPYRWDRIDYIRKGKAYKYCYPLSFPSPGRSYYQLANHDSIISSGWLDVLEAIPQFKKYGMANQMSLLYHIEVSAEYWPRIYGERWETADYDGKMAIRDEFLTDLMKKLTNVQNAHSSVMTDKWVDDEGKEQGVTIHVLKDIKTDGKFNEDNSEGNSHMLYAMGMDATIVGFSGNAAQRSGGSDKREAFWIFLMLSYMARRKALELLYLVADYNGWTQRYPNLQFKFYDPMPEDLRAGDKNKQEPARQDELANK